MVGVNGTGKTTTIGKLAWHLCKEFGHSVVLAAGDTFRAAGGRAARASGPSGPAPSWFAQEPPAPIPAPVAFDAIAAARARGADVVIVDTAGRLHTQDNLMDELAKVRRVIAKQIPEAPHETLLSIDATTGQNGLRQAQVFSEAVDVDGVVLTKLDGTAKGGIVARDRQRARHPGEADRRRRDARGPAALSTRPTSPARCWRSSARSKLGSAVFDQLSDRFRRPSPRSAARGKLSEADVDAAMREIRLALLEADVNFKVVKSFTSDAQGARLGRRGAGEPRPRPAGRQDRRRGADGADGRSRSRACIRRHGPTVILMAGLQGSGKTTACAKLARYLNGTGKDVALAACDVYRPAAIDQLVTLGERAGGPVYQQGAERDPVDIAEWALDSGPR